ncbi:MAG: hypothetical protein RI894_470 [Bacteroidota bacterium]|jgi:hypothetical protein
MQHRTELSSEKAPFRLSHRDTIIAIGSCFAENIGERLLHSTISTLINPFGIVYNPLSVAAQLQLLTTDTFFSESDIHFHNELYFSYLHHSNYNNTDKSIFLETINDSLKNARNHFENTNRLLITLGTAQVFFENKTQMPVANCHKQPAALFGKRRISVAETVASLSEVFEKVICKKNDLQKNDLQKNDLEKNDLEKNDLQIIISVSPVRYLREGIVESARSKAILLLAVEELCAQFSECYYFPAYEYLIDDLRDYRYYADDFLHPNAQAIAYIWEKFGETFFTNETQALNTRLHKIRTAQNHRALHPETKAHQRFLSNLDKEIAVLSRELGRRVI